jgi:hypothetical protein
MEGRIEEIKQTVREGMKNMENSKYCTPTIEEIKVGFELQYHNFSIDEAGIPELNYDRWDTTTLNENNVKVFMEYGIKGGIRVKHLDREDIESLGWKLTKDRDFEFDAQYLKKDDIFWDLTYDIEEHTLSIEEFYQSKLCSKQSYLTNPSLYSSRTVFQGTIRNKSELKTLMKWLNIN